MNFTTGAALLQLCQEEGLPISAAMLRREVEHLGAAPGQAEEKMRTAWEIMRASAHTPMEQRLTSMGGLIGGQAMLLREHRLRAAPVCGALVSKAIAYAMGVLEVNASMGLIVAAPTAGSSGVIPGVFLALQEDFSLDDSQMVAALWNAGAVGYLLMQSATVAGAEGGCQAEVGAASAMAASAAVELMGGSPAQCLDAAAIAVSNLLGLVCDPVAGLVEAPCQTRNAIGAANALTSAEIALSGIPSLIPFDEMAEAMLRVGHALPVSLRETAQGGCAATPTGCRLCQAVYGREASPQPGGDG